MGKSGNTSVTALFTTATVKNFMVLPLGWLKILVIHWDGEKLIIITTVALIPW